MAAVLAPDSTYRIMNDVEKKDMIIYGGALLLMMKGFAFLRNDISRLGKAR